MAAVKSSGLSENKSLYMAIDCPDGQEEENSLASLMESKIS